MTEDEAKDLWCPFTRVGEQASGAAENRPDGSFNCIASGCMAWRVQTIEAHQENTYNRSEPPDGEGWKPNTPSKTNRGWWRTVPETYNGYCGLAGAPS